MIRKRDDPTKKLSVIKRHPDDSPYLVNQEQHFQTGVSVDQNPLHQTKMEGCDVLYYIYQDHGNGSATIR